MVLNDGSVTVKYRRLPPGKSGQPFALQSPRTISSEATLWIQTSLFVPSRRSSVPCETSEYRHRHRESCTRARSDRHLVDIGTHSFVCSARAATANDSLRPSIRLFFRISTSSFFFINYHWLAHVSTSSFDRQSSQSLHWIVLATSGTDKVSCCDCSAMRNQAILPGNCLPATRGRARSEKMTISHF